MFDIKVGQKVVIRSSFHAQTAIVIGKSAHYWQVQTENGVIDEFSRKDLLRRRTKSSRGVQSTRLASMDGEGKRALDQHEARDWLAVMCRSLAGVSGGDALQFKEDLIKDPVAAFSKWLKIDISKPE